MQGRPQRSTRGRRPRPTQLQAQRDQAFYSAVFGADDDSGEDYEVLKKPLSVVRGEMLRMNIIGFPYARSHHYYYDLSLISRVGQSSYVEDPNFPLDLFHFKDKDLLALYNSRGFESEHVINRKYMGLPGNQPKTGKSIHGDKNPCHPFLFSNEDRKWRIDQLLYDLRYLQKNPEYVRNNKAKLFSAVRRDVELSSLYDVSIPFQNKMYLLETRIATLQARKARLADEFEFQDQLFFHSSLNQKYFNQQSASELSVNNILSQGMYLFSLSQEIRESEANEDRQRKVSLFFTVYSTIGLSNPILTDTLNDFLEHHIKSKIPPSYIMDFSNTTNLQRTEQILSIRALEVYGETTFYTLKTFWKKVFNKELTFEKEFVPMKKQDYAEQMRKIVRNYRQAVANPPSVSTATIPAPGDTEFLFGSASSIRLTYKQYILVYLAYYIYERVGYFNLEDRLIGSEAFVKYQFVISELVGYLFAATLEPAVKQFVAVLSGACAFSELNVDVFWELTPEKTGLIWMREKEVWETEEEEDKEGAMVEEEEEGHEISMSEPLRIELYDKPSKKIKEDDKQTD